MNRHRLFSTHVLATILAAGAAAIVAAESQPKTLLRSETFDRDPGWEGHKNHIVPKEYPAITQEFGYSGTGFAGKMPGEIGGRVHRASQPAYYAAKIATKTLNDRLSASGTFALTQSASGGGIFFGWFNGQQVPGTGRPMNSFGMSMDCEATGSRLQLYVITAQNQVSGTFITRYEKYRTSEERNEKRPTPIKPDGTRYTWKLDYDPAAAEGRGQFQFMVKSSSAEPQDFEGKTFTVDLPAGFKEQGTSFDHFGLMNLTRAGSPVTIYFDDLALDGRVQDFTKDPGANWIGSGNRTTYVAKEVGGAQDFGFRTTNRAGGAAGELAGITWRGPYAYYADRVGPFTLNDRLEARGRMFFEGAGLDAGVNIGWFNSEVKEMDDKNPTKAGNFVGVNIGGHTRVGHWFLPFCLTSKGERSFNDQGPLPLLKAGTTYEWSFLYDPAENAGNGRMKVTIGGASAMLNLEAVVKARGALLDRFGVSSVGTGGGEVKFSLDDLKYTAGKPQEAAKPGPPAAGALAQVVPKSATTQALPKVVLLGDSVREHYAPFVAELLAGKATVVTPKANGRDTGTLLTNLNEWAIAEKPDVVHFNCGIHDTKQIKQTGKNNVPPDQYETNLRELVNRFRAETKAKIVFALSTPLMDDRSEGYWKTRSYRLNNASVMEYNQIALRVMKELDVPVNDLPAALGTAAESARLHDAGGIHFTKEGSQKLAAAVASVVTNYLPAAKRK